MGAETAMTAILALLPWVAGGAAVGGVLRHVVTMACARRFGERFPWGTLAVNVSGCLLAGLLLAGAARHPDLGARETWVFGAVGLIGAYTTVSSFSLQVLDLARRGASAAAAAYVAASLVLCLLAAGVGFAAGAALPPTLVPVGTP